jgi:hypothetical protein
MNKQITSFFTLAVSLCLTASQLSAAPLEPESEPIHTTSDKAELTLSYGNLRQLIEDLQTKEAEKKQTPPVNATVRSAEYQLDIASKNLAKVSATFAVTTFSDDWVSLPLISDQYPIQQIEPANTVLTTQAGHLAFLTKGAGEHQDQSTRSRRARWQF